MSMNPQNTTIFQHWGWAGTIVAAVLILVLTAVATHYLVRLVRRLIEKASDGRVGGSIISNVIRVVMWVVGVGLMLTYCFDVNLTGLWGALGIGGIALSLGLQSTLSNLFGGFQVTLSREVSIGDWVTIGSVSGQVKDINWRKMIVEDSLGNLHNIPNSTVSSTTVTRLADAASIKLPIVLASSCDLEALERNLPCIAADALDARGMRYPGKTPSLTLVGTELAGISTNLLVFAKREFPTSAVSDAVMEAVVPYLHDTNALPNFHE